jgi:hypothetical protein
VPISSSKLEGRYFESCHGRPMLIFRLRICAGFSSGIQVHRTYFWKLRRSVHAENSPDTLTWLSVKYRFATPSLVVSATMRFGILGAYQFVLLGALLIDDCVRFHPEDKYLEHVPGTALLSELVIIGGHEVGHYQKFRRRMKSIVVVRS